MFELSFVEKHLAHKILLTKLKYYLLLRQIIAYLEKYTILLMNTFWSLHVSQTFMS